MQAQQKVKPPSCPVVHYSLSIPRCATLFRLAHISDRLWTAPFCFSFSLLSAFALHAVRFLRPLLFHSDNSSKVRNAHRVPMDLLPIHGLHCMQSARSTVPCATVSIHTLGIDDAEPLWSRKKMATLPSNADRVAFLHSHRITSWSLASTTDFFSQNAR